MKATIIGLIVVVEIFANDGDDLYNWDTLSTDLRTAFSYKGNVCISLGRRIGYNWRVGWNRMFNADYALGTFDAEYFFYQEQKVRDRIYKRLKGLERDKRGPGMSCCLSSDMKSGMKYDSAFDYRKEEYYCREPHDRTKLRQYCTWALYNRKLEKEGWLLDENVDPECEFRRIFLPRYGYKTKRTVLKCGYVTQKEGEPLRRFFAFISAVDNLQPLHRLILYLFKSRNASDPFLPAQVLRKPISLPASSDNGENVQKNKKRRRYPKEEDALPPLNLLTLLINKRYIFDYLKEKPPL